MDANAGGCGAGFAALAPAVKAPRRAGASCHGDAMHRLYFLPLVLLLALRGPPPASAQQAPASPFTSEAIDRGVFKEGEVRRLEGHFLSWRVVCDEVPRIKQRFCSLFTAGADAAGRPVTGLTVSTSDEGRPAAMIRLPHGVSIKRGLEVLTGPPAGNAPPPAKQPLKEKAAVLKLAFPSCDAQGCITLWNLTPKQIAALSPAVRCGSSSRRCGPAICG